MSQGRGMLRSASGITGCFGGIADEPKSDMRYVVGDALLVSWSVQVFYCVFIVEVLSTIQCERGKMRLATTVRVTNSSSRILPNR